VSKRITLVAILILALELSWVAAQEGQVEDTTKVGETYNFFGLASYYNDVKMYWVYRDSVEQVDSAPLNFNTEARWLAQVGRFRVAVWNTETLRQNSSLLSLSSDEFLVNFINQSTLVDKTKLIGMAPELDQLRYVHLWRPLSSLTKLAETCLVKIQSLSFFSSWGIAILVYCLLVKILLLPLSLLTAKLQRGVGEVNQILAPKLANIKSNYDGEEAHKRIMAAHKDLGVGPFYSLKPLLSTLIQIPVLIATFNALGEMPQINGSSFLWVDNLSYPDSVSGIGFSIPFIGNSVNLLPVLMTIVSVISTLIFTDRYAGNKQLRSQKRNLYLMALVFLVLFYPFPAAMVLYWMASNGLHLVQQKLFS